MKWPTLFISHGSPMMAIEDDDATRALESLGRRWGRPRAIVILSAHWEAGRPVRVTGAARPPLIYDFGGFPDALYELTYPSPGDPALSADVAARLGTAGIAARVDSARGLDHGVWVPLRRLFPAADVPVVEISLPVPRTASEVFEMGRALGPLRETGILLVGTGGIVHNLRRLRFGATDVDRWAADFDAWVAKRLTARDADGLLHYESAPGASLSVPASEHFDPLFFAMGAAGGEPATTVSEGFQHGNLSLRTVLFGEPSGVPA